MKKRRIERRRRGIGWASREAVVSAPTIRRFRAPKERDQGTMKSETGVIDGVMMDRVLDRQRRDLSDIGKMKPVL